MPTSGYFDTVFATGGSRTSVPDGVQSDGSVSYEQGWGVNYTLQPGTTGALDVDNDEMNQLFYDITAAIQNYQQNGIPPFITSAMNNGSPFSYAQYAQVLYEGVAYQSNVAGNTDTPPSSKWNPISLSSANQFVAGTSTGSVNAQVLASLSPANGFSTAINGQSITFTAGFTNTGSTTLAITAPSVSATVIKKVSGSSLVNLTGGEIVASAPVYVTWDLPASCWVLNSGPALGTMASLNIGNNMANDTNGSAVATVPSLALSGTNKTFQLGQWGALISRSNSGTPMADTLPGTSGALSAGWYIDVENNDPTAPDVVGLGAGGSLSMGNQSVSSIAILPGETWRFISQGMGVYVAARLAGAVLAAAPLRGAAKNLVCSYVDGTHFSMAADEFIVEDTSGNTRKLASVNVTVNSGATGANGLDTGSLAASTWYYGHVIFNPATGTIAGLMSLSSTAPTLPSGYSLFGLAVPVYSGSGSTFGSFKSFGPQVYFPPVSALSVGTNTGGASVSLAAIVPPNARTAGGSFTVVGIAASQIGADASFTGGGNIEANSLSNGVSALFTNLPLVTPQSMYYQCGSGSGAYVSINISHFSF